MEVAAAEEKPETARDNEAEDNDNDNATEGDMSNANFNGASGDYNQMQMMMAMQNGMNPSAFGGFPMMGRFSSRIPD
jgi:hypothetical protein